MKIDITNNACIQIQKLIQQDTEENKKIALRVSVDSGGCSGFMYRYSLINQIKENDYILEKNNIKIAIDPISQQFLTGCTIEFIEELGASYFHIINPKAANKCGCGNSFSI